MAQTERSAAIGDGMFIATNPTGWRQGNSDRIGIDAIAILIGAGANRY